MTTTVMIVIGVIVLSFFVIGIVLVVVLTKKKTNSGSIPVNVNLLLGGVQKQTTFQIGSTIGDILVEAFMATVFGTAKLLTTCHPSDAIFNKITIASKDIELDANGKISGDSGKQKLSLLVGSSPDSIDVMIDVKLCCDPNAPKNCDPCREMAVCQPDGTYKCVPTTSCVSDPNILSKCCPVNQLVSCQGNGIVCKDCDDTSPFIDSKSDCDKKADKEPCKGWGMVCRNDGWHCEENVACPADESKINSCVSCQDGMYPVCQNGEYSCASCQGPTPKCPPDGADECDCWGIVCVEGKQVCQKNSACPSEDVRERCSAKLCTSSDNPYVSCKTDGGHVSLVCSGCGPYPDCNNAENEKCCQGSCQGHAFKCTPKGWVCVPGQKCPEENVWDALGCKCGDGQHPVCDPDSKCVKCECTSGTQCHPPSCIGDKPNLGDNVCCEHNDCQQDNNDPTNPNFVCCPSADQVCHVNGVSTCCPDGQVCRNNSCATPCGFTADNQPFFCQQNQSCVVIDDLSDDNIGKLKKEYGADVRVDQADHRAYVCMNPTTCVFQDEIALPASVNNYYPCYEFPAGTSDPANPGAGYCTEQDTSESVECMNAGLACSGATCTWSESSCVADSKCQWVNDVCVPKDTKILECAKNKDEKSCASDGNCQWRDILKTMSGSTDTMTSWKKIESELSVMYGKPNGKFCDPSNKTTPYGRVVTFESSGCSVDDCWAHVSQPNVIDVEYNTQTGVCSSLQSCNNPAGGSGSGLNAKTLDGQPVKSITPESPFPACSSSVSCPISDTDYSCDKNNGDIYSGCDKCSKSQLCQGNNTCRCSDPNKGGWNCDMFLGSPNFADISKSPVGISYDSSGTLTTVDPANSPLWAWQPDGKLCLVNDTSKCAGFPKGLYSSMGLVGSGDAPNLSMDSGNGYLFLKDQPSYYLFNTGGAIGANNEWSKGHYGSWIQRRDITDAQYDSINSKQRL